MLQNPFNFFPEIFAMTSYYSFAFETLKEEFFFLFAILLDIFFLKSC